MSWCWPYQAGNKKSRPRIRIKVLQIQQRSCGLHPLFQLLGRDLITAVQLAGPDRQPCGQVLLYVESVLFVEIRKVSVIRMLRDIVLPGQEGPHAPDLQEALPSVHHRQLVHAHKVYATLSSDEFNFAHKKAGTPRIQCHLVKALVESLLTEQGI